MLLLPIIVTAALTAPAPVTFDFATATGFVDATDIREAFDWTGARLTRKAPRIEFQSTKIVEESWSVVCTAGTAPFPAVRSQQSMKEFLIAAPTYDPNRKLTGFRLTGSRAAISSTTAPFDPGTPCPDPTRGTTIHSSRQVATTTTRSLLAVTGPQTATLLETRTGPPTP